MAGNEAGARRPVEDASKALVLADVLVDDQEEHC
jgi:hypothetical protein